MYLIKNKNKNSSNIRKTIQQFTECQISGQYIITAEAYTKSLSLARKKRKYQDRKPKELPRDNSVTASVYCPFGPYRGSPGLMNIGGGVRGHVRCRGKCSGRRRSGRSIESLRLL